MDFFPLRDKQKKKIANYTDNLLVYHFTLAAPRWTKDEEMILSREVLEKAGQCRILPALYMDSYKGEESSRMRQGFEGKKGSEVAERVYTTH